MVRTAIEVSYRCFKVQLIVHTRTESGVQNTFTVKTCLSYYNNYSLYSSKFTNFLYTTHPVYSHNTHSFSTYITVYYYYKCTTSSVC